MKKGDIVTFTGHTDPYVIKPKRGIKYRITGTHIMGRRKIKPTHIIINIDNYNGVMFSIDDFTLANRNIKLYKRILK